MKTNNTVVKGIVTLCMWAAAMSLGESATSSPFVEGGDMALVIVMPLLFAFLGTLAVWVLPEIVKIFAPGSATETTALPAKAKRAGDTRRDEQLAILLELLDDDEREVFKERLQQRVLDNLRYSEGELPETDATLAALLDEENQRQQRR